jgi:hypothetical protein
MVIGGDLINSSIQSGYVQALASAVAALPTSTLAPPTGVFYGSQLPTIINRVKFSQATNEPLAHGGGDIHARIAGNVTNSIISASVDPDPSGINNPGQFQNATSRRFPFGAPDNIVLAHGSINVKVEGTVNNSGIQSGTNQLISPDIPATSAFFAKNVTLEHGPVIPPSVPTAPYPSPVPYHRGQRTLKGVFKRDKSVKHPRR